MTKKIIVVFSVLLCIFLFGCKGRRSIKVLVQHQDAYWSGLLSVDNKSTTYTAQYSSREIDLGDVKAEVRIMAARDNPIYATKNLRVAIVEEFEPGFLYMAASNVIVEDSNNTNTSVIIAVATYDFKDRTQ